MLSFLSLPAKVISIIEGNISPREIAFGVCLGLFLGLIPLNGPMAFLLAMFFFFFKINRVATLLTLPAFKAAYLLGLYRVADTTGMYILEKAGSLAGFWRWVTHLPVVSYLELNNTLIAGGMLVAAALSVPMYFIAKRSVIFLSVKYSEKIKRSPLAKLIPGVKLMGLVGDDTEATLKNVKARVQLDLKTKIVSAFAKKKAPAQPGSFLKRIKIANIAIVVILLAVFHFGTGLFLSPMFGTFIVDSINAYSGAKITIDKVNIWPLTLSFSLKGMKVFDPERPDARIAKIDESSIMISPLDLLSKRLVFSRIHMRGAEINVEGTADGTFNIRRVAPAQRAAAQGPDLAWRSLMQKKDLFGKTYEIIKKRFAKKSKGTIQEERASAKKVTTTVQELPKGRLVHFKNAEDRYLFEIKDLVISDAYVKMTISGTGVDIRDANIRLGRAAYDPENGARIDLIDLKGKIVKGATPAGTFDIFFSKSAGSEGPKAVCRARLDDVDLDAVRFIYEDSLPVHVSKGLLTLRTDTRIEAGGIDSRNEVSLRGQALEPKAGGSQAVGFVPIAAICEAMNRADPLKLNFTITGSLDKPEFGGFQESLMALIKPYIADVTEKIKSEGLKALGQLINKTGDSQPEQAATGGDSKSSDLDSAVNSLKSLFGTKKE